MKELQATVDLEFIKEVMQKTHRRIDTHAFHTIIWGCIVLVWYPLGNYFVQQEMMAAYFALIPICLVLGSVLSGVSEYRRSKTPLEGENTFISRQIIWVVWGSLIPAAIFSALLPATGFIDGRNVPTVWGVAYANLAFMIGVVYSKEYIVSGLVIFAGVILAIAMPHYNGYILGPFMGLGMMIPGVVAERRVRAIRMSDGEG